MQVLTLARVVCSRSLRAEIMNSDFVDQQGQIITDSESADRQGPGLGPSRNRVFCSRKSTLCDDIFTFWQTNIKMLSASRG